MHEHRTLRTLARVRRRGGSALSSSALAVGTTADANVVGDAARGEPLFSDTFNCYACHGFDAQSGERRLVPMNYTQEGFITFVQNSPLPNMPAVPRRLGAAARRHLRVYPHDSRRRAGASATCRCCATSSTGRRAPPRE